MTNLEAIQANISDAHGVVLTESHFVKALIDVGLTPEVDYSSSRAVDRATLRLYDQLIASANLSEGSLGYNVNVEGLRQARKMIADRLGIVEDKRNEVNTSSPW
jgi:hypothetical protein